LGLAGFEYLCTEPEMAKINNMVMNNFGIIRTFKPPRRIYPSVLNCPVECSLITAITYVITKCVLEEK